MKNKLDKIKDLKRASLFFILCQFTENDVVFIIKLKPFVIVD